MVKKIRRQDDSRRVTDELQGGSEPASDIASGTEDAKDEQRYVPGRASLREESRQSRSFRVLKLNKGKPEKGEPSGQGKEQWQDKSGGAMDKLKGRLKEVAGAVTGDEATKSEGRSDQTKGTAKEKKGKIKDLFK